MSILSQEFVFTAIEAEKTGNQFPIDLDDVWQALGYSRKDNAVRNVLSDNFISGVDYQSAIKRTVMGGTPKHVYKFSIEGFKMFCMMAHTQVGREVRKYFIDVEKAYRQGLEIQFNHSTEYIKKIQQLEKENVELTKALKKLLESNNRLLKNIADKKSKNISCDKDLTEYTQHSEELWQTSGISSYRYFKGACFDELEFNKDYKWLGDGHMMLTRHAAVKMLIILRSESGLILDRVPDAKVTIRDLVKKSDTKINRRSPQAN